jgi:hypothetical protein
MNWWNEPPPWPLAGRRVPRPATVERCSACGAFLGRNHPDCLACCAAVEAPWRADWGAFLAAEGIAAGGADERTLAGVVAAEVGRHPWTLADWALTFLTCPECGGPLGGGDPECTECAFAFGNLWAPELERGATANEHALRVGRWVTRHPHRHSAAIVTGWALSLPFLLTGGLPTTAQAQRLAARLKAGGDPVLLAGCRTPGEAVERVVGRERGVGGRQSAVGREGGP